VTSRLTFFFPPPSVTIPLFLPSRISWLRGPPSRSCPPFLVFFSLDGPNSDDFPDDQKSSPFLEAKVQEHDFIPSFSPLPFPLSQTRQPFEQTPPLYTDSVSSFNSLLRAIAFPFSPLAQPYTPPHPVTRSLVTSERFVQFVNMGTHPRKSLPFSTPPSYSAIAIRASTTRPRAVSSLFSPRDGCCSEPFPFFFLLRAGNVTDLEHAPLLFSPLLLFPFQPTYRISTLLPLSLYNSQQVFLSLHCGLLTRFALILERVSGSSTKRFVPLPSPLSQGCEAALPS